LRIGGCDHAEDFFGGETCCVDALHRERGVSIRDLVRDGFRHSVPSRSRLVPCCEAAPAFVVSTDEVVGDGSRQPGRQRDAEPGAQGAVAGEAPGEVALHDHRNAASEMALDLFGCCEQCGEVEAHPGFDVRPFVHLAPEGLIEGRHGGNKNGLTGSGEQWSDRRLPGAP
jgi:hypothetical protein